MRSFVQVSAFRLPLLGSILLISGCATLSKEECTVGNWQTIGYNDGVAGYYSNRLAAHAKACAKVGTAPDYQTWERGRVLGLKQYCTVDNAYNIGKRGKTINSVCPAEAASQLQRGNQQGLTLYKLNNDIERDNKLLEKYQDEFEKLREGELLHFKNEKDARAYYIKLPSEFRRITQRITQNEFELRRLSRLYERSL